MSSPYRSTNIPGHGTASAIAITPIDIVTDCCNRNLGDSDINNLPCEQES